MCHFIFSISYPVNEMAALTPECQTWDLEMGICREPYRYSQFGLQCNQLPGSKPEMITSDTLCLTVLFEVCERKTAIFRPSMCRCKYP